MASTSPKIDSHAVVCDDAPTAEAEQKFMDVCSKMQSTLSSPPTSGSPSKPTQTIPVDKSGSPLTSTDPEVHGSTAHQNGDQIADKSNSGDDVKLADNGAEQTSSSDDTLTAESSAEKNVEMGQTAGAVEGSESGDKPEQTGSEAGVEGEQSGEDGVEKDAHFEGKTTECGEHGAAVDGSAGKDATEDVEQKIDLVKLNESPKVESPTKTSCAAI